MELPTTALDRQWLAIVASKPSTRNDTVRMYGIVNSSYELRALLVIIGLLYWIGSSVNACRQVLRAFWYKYNGMAPEKGWSKL